MDGNGTRCSNRKIGHINPFILLITSMHKFENASANDGNPFDEKMFR